MWDRARRISDEKSFAVPVMAEDRLLATLTIRFASTAVSETDGIERFVPKLRSVAKQIGDEFVRQHQEDNLILPVSAEAS